MTLNHLFLPSSSSSSSSFVYPSPLNDFIESNHLISQQQVQQIQQQQQQQQVQAQEHSLPPLLWDTPIIPMEPIHSNFNSLFDTTTDTNTIYPSTDTTIIPLNTDSNNNSTIMNHLIQPIVNNNNKYLSFNSLSHPINNISDPYYYNNISQTPTPSSSPPPTRISKLTNDTHYRLNQANLRQHSNYICTSNLSSLSSSLSSSYRLQRPNSPDLIPKSSTASISSSPSSQSISSSFYLPPPLPSFLLAN